MYGFETGEWAPIGTREEFMAELRALAQETAPKVFALCEEVGDRYCGHVEYWGLAFEDRAALMRESGRLCGTFNSAESAHRLFSRAQNLHLIWIEPKDP